MKPTEAQLCDAFDRANFVVGLEGGTRSPSKSYEQGVACALAWVLGYNDAENPTPDDTYGDAEIVDVPF